MSYCDTCGHQFSDICGTCESINGVPVQFSPKPSDVRPIKDDGIIGIFDYATGNFTPTRKITNADIIRHMTDEELAEWINRLEPYKCHKGYRFVNGCWENETDCIACILEWLKQEVGT